MYDLIFLEFLENIALLLKLSIIQCSISDFGNFVTWIRLYLHFVQWCHDRDHITLGFISTYGIVTSDFNSHQW